MYTADMQGPAPAGAAMALEGYDSAGETTEA
jgi:hypothetical protein